MKKIFTVLLLVMLLCSCSKTQPVTQTPSEPTQTSPAEVTPDKFYTDITSSDARPIAVMIDNDDETARPPAGVENAYLVYEITVEGAATRLMALFKNHDVSKVGPIRSARHYFLDYVLENDAIYVHAGQSPKAGNDIVSLGLPDINGITGSDGQYFHRDYTYTSSWHTLYTGTDKMAQLAASKNFNMKSDGLLYSYNENDTALEGNPAS